MTPQPACPRLGASPPPPRPTVIEADGGRRRRPPALHCTAQRPLLHWHHWDWDWRREGDTDRIFIAPSLLSGSAAAAAVGRRHSAVPFLSPGLVVVAALFTCALWGPSVGWSGSTGKETLRLGCWTVDQSLTGGRRERERDRCYAAVTTSLLLCSVAAYLTYI